MSWTNQTTTLSSFSNQAGQTADIDRGIGFLLNELAGYILQENGGKIILEESTNYAKQITWVNETESSDTFSNQSMSSATWANES